MLLPSQLLCVCAGESLYTQSSLSQYSLLWTPSNSAAPGKTLTACLQATKTAAPAAVEMSGLPHSARAAAAKSQGKQKALKAVAEEESVAARGPIPLAGPAALASAVEVASRVGCGSVT